MNCPICGHEARGRFCTMCGTRMERRTAPVAPMQSGALWSSTLPPETAANRTAFNAAGSTIALGRADIEEISARVTGIGQFVSGEAIGPLAGSAPWAGPTERTVTEEAHLEAQHFYFSCPVGSLAAQNLKSLGERLEEVYEAIVELLGGAVAAEKIVVRLSELLTDPQGRPLDRESVVIPGRMEIYEVYRSDAPGNGLERSILLVLLAAASGGESPPPPLVVDGLLTRAMQRVGSVPESDQLMPTLVAAQESKALPPLRAMLQGPAPETAAVYVPAAADFMGFLLGRRGPETFIAFLRALQTYEPERAIREAFGRDLDRLDREWRKTLKAAQPGGILHFMSLLRPYLRPYRRPIAEIVLYIVLTVSFGIGLAKMQGILLDRALLPRDQHALAVIMGILVAAFVVVLLSSLRQSYVTAFVSESVLRDMRLRMFSLVQRLHPGFFDTHDTGDTISRMTSDLAAIDTALTGSMTQGLRMVLTVVGATIMIFVTDWRLATVAVVGIPLFFIVGSSLGPAVARSSKERQENLSSTTSALHENLGTQQVVKAFGLQRRVIDSFRRNLDTLFYSSLRLTFLSGILSLSAYSVAIAIQLVVLGIGGFLVTAGNLTAGTLFAFLALTAQIIGPMLSLSTVLQSLHQANGAMERVDELLRAKPAIESPPSAVPLRRLSSCVRFEAVTFSYADGRPALQDLTLEIPAAAHVALVGPSGCGKSTVVRLLMRFYDPQGGRVSVDGVDLREVDLDTLRGQTGTVFQESVLLNLSIRENIRLGNLAATDDEVEAAARAAEIHDLIMDMPEGYDTVVGEQGSRLSGGQRQRISIARAIVRNPAILLLDEATSALDPRTEAAINQTIVRLGEGRTTIAVTHRLASVVDADRIYVLDRGRLAEEGRHDELLRKGGLYSALWEERTGYAAGHQPAELEVSRLSSVPLLAGLSCDPLTSLARRLSVERFAAGDIIIRRGDVGDRLYLVESGEVEVFASNPETSQPPLAILRDGDHFGEIALLRATRRTATIRARTPVQLFSLRKEDFNALLTRLPELRTRLERTMADRARLSAG